MRVFEFLTLEDKKCAGCNWRFSTFYVIASSAAEAEKSSKELVEEAGSEYGPGNCAHCVIDWITRGYELLPRRIKRKHVRIKS